jgi:hypothetical protein
MYVHLIYLVSGGYVCIILWFHFLVSMLSLTNNKLEGIQMKVLFHLLMIGFLFSLTGCGKKEDHRNAADLLVDFTWEGLRRCGWGNPEISIGAVPDQTKFLKISMYDHAYSHDHGTVLTLYDGEKIIAMNRFKEIQGPCPVYTPGRYEITVKALGAHEAVIGVGSKERVFPEE